MKHLIIKHTRFPKAFNDIYIKDKLDESFVEFVTDDGRSFMVSCNANELHIQAYSTDGTHPQISFVPHNNSMMIAKLES